MLIKVLIATSKTQGFRANDFSHTEEGELVGFGALECDREQVDGHCGCRRSLVGLRSGKATTTFKVAEMECDLSAEISRSLINNGWGGVGEDEIAKIAKDDAKGIQHIASGFAVGTVLERRGETYKNRKGN